MAFTIGFPRQDAVPMRPSLALQLLALGTGLSLVARAESPPTRPTADDYARLGLTPPARPVPAQGGSRSLAPPSPTPTPLPSARPTGTPSPSAAPKPDPTAPP